MEIDYRLALEELAQRIIAKESEPDILSVSFPQQRAFVEDQARKKVIFCTRRASKSFSLGLKMVKTAREFPNSNIWFIGLSRESAKDIIWKDVLLVLNDKYNLGAIPNLTALTLTFPNGSLIKITGVDSDADEMKKLLGKKFKLVCIDEASMYTISIEALVDLIEPAVIDQDGTICLAGTASNFPRGIFFDITTGKRKDWKLFQWSALDNPFVAKQWAAKLDEIATQRPLYMETPQYKQWYLNQWVVDEEKLVYKFDPNKNLIKAIPMLPHDGWTFVLGVDTGWEDASAFVLTGYHLNDPNLYVIKVFAKSKMNFDDLEARADFGVVQKIQEYMKDSIYAPHRVIIDGANKQGVESMRHRSNIPFEYADKQDKVTFIELCNSDLIQGRIKVLDIPENRPLWDEWMNLVWVTDGDKIKYPKKEHPSLSNHLCDAHLYAWRCGYHYSSTPAEKKIVVGSREWYQKQSDDTAAMWENERDRLERMTSGGNWPNEGSLGDLG